MPVVDLKLRNRPVDDRDVTVAYNRELVPAFNQVQAAVVRRFGDVVTVTGDYQALVTDQYILVDATAADVAVTLPDVSATDMRITVKKTDASANLVTVAPSESTATIDGLADSTLFVQWESVCTINDGANWFVI